MSNYLCSGLIDMEKFEAALRPDTSLVRLATKTYKLRFPLLFLSGQCDAGEQRDRSDPACGGDWQDLQS